MATKKKLAGNTSQRIHGIYDVKKKKMLYVHLDMEQVELEYDMGSYLEPQQVIVTLEILIVNNLAQRSQ